MKILFMHPNFPAQFLNLCLALGTNKNYELVFLTTKKEYELDGVRKVYYEQDPPREQNTHPFIHSVEKAVMQGQSAFKAAKELKDSGFYPDIILGHSGWGSTLFMKDLFPDAALIGYYEWFYHSHGTDLDFDPSNSQSIDDELRTRTVNLPFLLDLAACDAGISPTQWQRSQFPSEHQHKIAVCHDGIQTERYVPAAGTKIVFPELGIDLAAAQEVVTYVGRGMEPYRGYPQFMLAMQQVLQQRPGCHVVIVGAERIAYGGKKPAGYASYKEWARKEVKLDWSRIHYTDLLPRNRYLEVLQASSVHVYLTYPFVLSWSMMEAMSAGCLLVASDTPPVREVITNGENGLLVDFFDVPAIAAKVVNALANQDEYQPVRAAARQTIVSHYNWRNLLPKQVEFMTQIARQVRMRQSSARRCR